LRISGLIVDDLLRSQDLSVEGLFIDVRGNLPDFAFLLLGNERALNLKVVILHDPLQLLLILSLIILQLELVELVLFCVFQIVLAFFVDFLRLPMLLFINLRRGVGPVWHLNVLLPQHF